MDFHDDLMFPALRVRDRDELLDKLGGAVVAAGFARDDYVDGLKAREREYPTGLPISGGVAIPHTSAEYVTTNTIVAASLTEPVTFAEMGGADDSEVSVSTVFLLVIADSTQQVKVLGKLIRALQNAEFVKSVHDAVDRPTMASLLEQAVPA